jgi:hypothetical protein
MCLAVKKKLNSRIYNISEKLNSPIENFPLHFVCIEYHFEDEPLLQVLYMLYKNIFEFLSILCVTQFQIGRNRQKFKILPTFCQTKVHRKDQTLCNLNSTMTYPSFESFLMYMIIRVS